MFWALTKKVKICSEKEVFEVDPFEFDHSIFAQPLENNLSGDSIASTSVTVERCAIRIENLLDEKHSVILHLRMASFLLLK